jgi:arsenate reductase
MAKLKILFLCTGNSCRSQMAEGWARALKGDMIEPFSAGIETHGMNPSAIAVMAEAGVDISAHHSKLVADLAEHTFDYVVTVCGHAAESCPVFPGNSVIVHRGFPDPPLLATEVAERGGGAEAQLDCYREVRDQIKAYIMTLPESLCQ